jgi:mannose-6-phosphate isomerase-like protein (cupin superfamily)
MSDAVREIRNPRTGQRLRFLEERPEVLRIESLNPVVAEREPVHVHPRQTSGAKVVAGELVFEVDGRRRRLGPGDAIEVAPGARHRFWNEGSEDALSVQYFEPALDTAAFFETLFALAARGELDAKGMPKPLPLSLLVGQFGAEIRPVSPPWPVLRSLAAVLAPLARARGHRARIVAE